jgi:metal-dependent amidase/aminoacylase/carboxypeptidase family protein
VLTIAQLAAGTTNNVIPERARLVGTLRTVNERTRHAVWERIRTVADGIASAHSCTAEVTVVEGYPVTVNDPSFTAFATEVTRGVLGDRRVVEMPAPVMGAEDFSYLLRKVPGAMFFLGVCPPHHDDPFSAPACHSNRMVLHEDAMAAGVALHAAVATSFLERGGALTTGG